MAIYLDHAATTPLRREALDAMLPYLTEDFGNASSAHGFGRRARAALDEAHQRMARRIGAEPREIVFTSGGTEALTELLKKMPADEARVILDRVAKLGDLFIKTPDGHFQLFRFHGQSGGRANERLWMRCLTFGKTFRHPVPKTSCPKRGARLGFWAVLAREARRRGGRKTLETWLFEPAYGQERLLTQW
jgi:hypothetical protein